MASEELYDGIINLSVYGAQESQEALQQYVQSVSASLERLSGLSVGSVAGVDFSRELREGLVDVERLGAALRELRAQGGAIDTAVPGVDRELRNLDALIAKTEQLRRVQALPPVNDPRYAVAAAETRAYVDRTNQELRREPQYGPGLAGLQRQATVQRAERGVENSADAVDRAERKLAGALEARAEVAAERALYERAVTLSRNRGRENPAAEEGLAQTIQREAAIEAEIEKSRERVQRAQERLATATDLAAAIRDRETRAARVGTDGKERFKPNVEAFDAEANARLTAAPNSLEQAQARVLAAENALAVAVEKEAASQEAADANYGRAKAARLAAEQALERELTKHAEAEAQAATAAAREAEASRVQGSEKRRLLLAGSDEFLQGQGIAGEGTSKSQQLAIEKQRLELSRQQLLVKAQNVTDEKELDRLVEQRIGIERRILANAEAGARQSFNEGGRGGFFGGFLGNHGGSPDGVSRSDVGFQVGQAAKYYALYSGLSLIQRGISGLISISAEYSEAQSDLGVAMGKSTAEASDAAGKFAEIGAKYGSGPIEAVQGAAKYIRTFSAEELAPANGTNPAGRSFGQSPDAVNNEIGQVGARLASLIGVLEKPERVQPLTQDIIALIRGYGGTYRDAPVVYDKAQGASQAAGFSAGEVLGGAAAISDIGKQSGYSIEQLVALVASVMQQTGTSSDAVAGDLKRILGSQDSTALNSLFENNGVSLDQTFQKRIEDLSKVLATYSPEKRAQQVASVGDPRTAAVLTATLNTAAAQARAAQAGGTDQSAGLAERQAQRKLDNLGKSFDLFVNNLYNSAIALGDLGLTSVLTEIVRAGIGATQALTAVADALGAVPKPITEIVSAVAALYAATRFASALKGAAATSPVLSALVGGGAGAGAAAAATSAASNATATAATAAANLRAAQQAQQLAIATGTATNATALQVTSARVAANVATAEAAAATSAATATTSLTARMGAMTASFLAAAPAMAVIAAAIGGFVIVSNEFENHQKGQSGTDSLIAGTRAGEAALKTGNRADIANAIDQLRSGRDDVIASSSGFSGKFADTVVPGLKEAREKVLANATKEYQRLQAAQDAIDGRVAGAKDSDILKAGEDFFARDFSGLSYGVDKIKNRGIAPDAATKLAGQAIQGANLQQLLGPTDGNKGIAELVKIINDRIARESNPEQQQAQYQELARQLSILRARAGSQGTAEQADAASLLAEEAEKVYLASLVSNVKSRIDSIKSLQGDTTKSRSQITALIQGGLRETLARGDIGNTVALLQGVDRAFLTTFRKLLEAERAALKSKADALRAAAAAASVDAATAREIRSGELEGVAKPGAIARGDITAADREKANRALRAADAQIKALDTAAGLTNFSNSSFNFPQDKAAKGPTAEEIELARLAAQAIPGDQYSQATTSLKIAKYQLDHAKDQKAYYDALKGLRDAQYEVARLALDQANNARLLTIDITDPLAQARNQVVAAKNQLAFDKRRGATAPTIQGDQVAVRQATATAASTAFQQQFGDYQTNYELQRISLSAYLRYLNTQKTYLTAVKNKTRDQVDQLNQVDRALKGLADGLQGQFNLGDIKLPTPYEVRRSLASGAGSSVTTNYVTVSGADTRAVLDMLSRYLGLSTVQAATTSPSRV